MNKHIFYHEKQKQQKSFDKSTVYDGSTEEPQHHPNFPKPKTSKLFNVITIPACIWAALAWLNAQYNIGQGDLNPHNWKLMNAATAMLFMYWSAKLFEGLVNINYTKEWVEKLAKIAVYICSATFIWFGLVLIHTVFEFVINLLNK